MDVADDSGRRHYPYPQDLKDVWAGGGDEPFCEAHQLRLSFLERVYVIENPNRRGREDVAEDVEVFGKIPVEQ